MSVDDPLSMRFEIFELRIMLELERMERRIVTATSAAALVGVALAFAAGLLV